MRKETTGDSTLPLLHLYSLQAPAKPRAHSESAESSADAAMGSTGEGVGSVTSSEGTGTGTDGCGGEGAEIEGDEGRDPASGVRGVASRRLSGGPTGLSSSSESLFAGRTEKARKSVSNLCWSLWGRTSSRGHWFPDSDTLYFIRAFRSSTSFFCMEYDNLSHSLYSRK